MSFWRHDTMFNNFYIYIYSISIKRIVCLSLSVCLSVSVCLNAFAHFLRYRAENLQVGRGRPGTGRGGVKNCGGPRGGVGGWSGQFVLGAPAGGCGTVGEEGRGKAGGKRGGGGGSGEEAGEGWAVVKARATPGNPASILILNWSRILRSFFLIFSTLADI